MRSKGTFTNLNIDSIIWLYKTATLKKFNFLLAHHYREDNLMLNQVSTSDGPVYATTTEPSDFKPTV